MVFCDIEVTSCDVPDVRLAFDDTREGESFGEGVDESCFCGGREGVNEIEVGGCEECDEELAVAAYGDVFDPGWEGELMDYFEGKEGVEDLLLSHSSCLDEKLRETKTFVDRLKLE